VDGNRCPIHLIELAREKEDNYFFKLSEFQDELEKLLDSPGFILPAVRRNEALSFVRQGLQDVSLTRKRLRWGVPVPWDDGHVFYVWFDALLNYYTALSFAHEGEDLTERFWPATLHLIAKDILKFHTVFWPALLMAAGLELPKRIYIHGYLLMDEHKMSKSLGNVIDPFQVSDKFGVDALRHYLLAAVSFGQDGSVSPEDFETRYTTELANEYGNLAARTLAMIRRYRDGVVPDSKPPEELAGAFAGLPEQVRGRMDAVEVTAALEEIWQRVRELNRYVQDEAPWQIAKDESAGARLDQILYGLAEGLRVVSILLHPFIPDSTGKLMAALGQDDLSLAAAQLGAVGGGARVGDLAPLFPRIESPSGS
jgi:methionyl-tRNA synthetase